MEAGHVVADRFEIERLAGEGGMGAVYRARDRMTDGPVALKLLSTLSAIDQNRFVREAEVLAELRHPGVVRYLAHGVSESRPFLAMEWLEGEDLQCRLSGDGVTTEGALRVVEQAARALGVAHAKGIVHRDVKPSNLFLVGGDVLQVKVLDFGIARLRGGRQVTQTGVLVGTPGYMSPEQARGEKDVDARTDVFALGCVLFACLTGTPAFEGEHVVALLARVLFEDAPRARELRPDLSREIDELVAKMLARSPGDRYADGERVAVAVAACESTTLEVRVRSSTREGPASLGGFEQRVLSVVLASPSKRSAAVGDAPTMVDLRGDGLLAVREATAAHGARVETLADGSLVAIITGSRAATDMAVQAARCSLAVRKVWDGPIALTTGRALIAGRLPLGEVVDRAAALTMVARDGVRIDDPTAGLLGARFEVRGDATGLELRGEREVIETTRTLLGKPTPCVGREHEIGSLMALFDRSVSEEVSGVVLVTGPAGIGKSRVRHEFLARLRERAPSVEVWASQADSVRAGSAFAMIAPPIRIAAGIQEGEPLESRRRKLAARVARNVPDVHRARVAAFLGDMIGVPFPAEATRELPAARVDGIVMGDMIRLAWQDFVEAETKEHPLVMVLEDLQWGDLPSVSMIDLGLRNLSERPWLVVAFARPEVDEVFPHLWSGRAAQRISLGQLPRKSGEKLVRAVLGATVSDARLAQIVERGAGNAFYLEELVRAHAEGRGENLPETVLAMVEARLGLLDSELRRVLRAASVFGRVFWTSAVSALLGTTRSKTPTDAALRLLTELEVIAPLGEGKFRGEIEWSFRHANLRDASYAMLTEADRVLGHALAAHWLEAAGEDDAVCLAEHWENAGDSAKAADWFARAAEQALEGNDLARTISLAEHALSMTPAMSTEARLHALLGEAQLWIGGYPAATDHGRLAIAGLAQGTVRWFVAMANLIVSCGHRADIDSVRQLLEQATRATPAEDAASAQIVCMARAHGQLISRGRSIEIDEVSRALIAAHADSPDDNVGGAVGPLIARRALIVGDLGTFLVATERAIECFERRGQMRRVVGERINLGSGLVEVGDFVRAETTLRHGLCDAQRLGLLAPQSFALGSLGNALHSQGKIAEGLQHERRSLEIARSIGEPRAEGASRAYLARMLLEAGSVEEAEVEGREACRLLSPSPPLLGIARAILSRVLLKQGRVAEAVNESTQAAALADAGVEEGEAVIRLTHAQALRAAGETDASSRAIVLARERLLARAARIQDPNFRRSFLELVPESAETLRLAEEWGWVGR